MENKKFKNLYDFFDYIEFCPLCRGRMSATVGLSGISSYELSNKELALQDMGSSKRFTINLIDNYISNNYLISVNPVVDEIVVGKQCSKYHFFYNGVAILSKSDLLIRNIVLDKYHFIRIHGPTHFTVNGSLVSSTTKIRITTENFNTREIVLPFVDFDLSSKKRIDTKLRNIQLLG